MKRKKTLTRRKRALHRLALAVLALLAVNHTVHIGYLLPIQGVHDYAQRHGLQHCTVITRLRPAGEDEEAGLLYFSTAKNAVYVTDVRHWILGWSGSHGAVADCSGDEAVHMNWLDWDGSVAFFGRVESAAAARVEVALQRGSEQLTFTIDDFLEKDGRRYILSFMDWDFRAVLPDAYTITATVYSPNGEALEQHDLSRGA